MMKLLWIFATLAPLSLLGQTVPQSYSYQQHGWIGFPATGSAVTVHHLRPDGQTGPVQGQPFSATEVRHTRQTLNDGTQVDRTDTSAFYRDAHGRMRSESPSRILIYDPIAAFTYNLDTLNKTYEKFAIRHGIGATSIAVVGDSTWVKSSSDTGPHMPVESGHVGATRPFHSESATASWREDLPQQTVNGIPCKSSRITITIAAGTFGNDREIKVMNERWYSEVLQVLVKTVNSDPRFGLTTYDLTNIVQAAPDPVLFRVPADYRLRSSTNHD